jgi:hypothetical protein
MTQLEKKLLFLVKAIEHNTFMGYSPINITRDGLAIEVSIEIESSNYWDRAIKTIVYKEIKELAEKYFDLKIFPLRVFVTRRVVRL